MLLIFFYHNLIFSSLVFIITDRTNAKMVLADLGRKITAALNSLSKATVIDEDVLKSLLNVSDDK